MNPKRNEMLEMICAVLAETGRPMMASEVDRAVRVKSRGRWKPKGISANIHEIGRQHPTRLKQIEPGGLWALS